MAANSIDESDVKTFRRLWETVRHDLLRFVQRWVRHKADAIVYVTERTTPPRGFARHSLENKSET